MKNLVSRRLQLFAILAAALAGFLAAACSSGPERSESNMTSYSGGATKADTPELFTLPQDQMAHIQIAAVQKTRLPRILRLTGAVAYNAFKTTPVFSPIGGPVHEILVAPGHAYLVKTPFAGNFQMAAFPRRLRRYSGRSASITSTRAARLAGSSDATAAAPSSTAAEPITGSAPGTCISSK